MTWFAAHILIHMRRRDRQGSAVIYENIYLLEAESSDDAIQQANKIGRAEALDDPNLTIDGCPAETLFSGVRKVITIRNPSPLNADGDRPVSGTEISFLQYELDGEEKLSEILRQNPAAIRLIE